MPSRWTHLVALFAILLATPLVLGPSVAADETPITVDGRLDIEEWGAGADRSVADQGWARWDRRDNGLYIAIRTNKVAMVDVFVQRGDELHQLHASGRVGGALFRRGDDQLWHLEHSYPWIGKEAKPRQSQADMKDRLRDRLRSKAPKPDPNPAPASGSAEAPAPPKPPMAPPKPPSLPMRDSAEDKATVARHLDDHGWTATLLNMGEPTTTEFFLSSDFLRPGDRILVQWPVRTETGFGAAAFPDGAELPPTEHSAAFEAQPFALSTDSWFVVE